MPITRTPMVDDDGSGTTGTIINNAWKTELYGQIDVLAGMGPTAWTPSDASGAGLVIASGASAYVRIGSAVFVVGAVTYPSNANAARARIGGLPIGNGGYQTGFFCWNAPESYQLTIVGGDTTFYINNQMGAIMSNSNLSGQAIGFAGFYLL